MRASKPRGDVKLDTYDSESGNRGVKSSGWGAGLPTARSLSPLALTFCGKGILLEPKHFSTKGYQMGGPSHQGHDSIRSLKSGSEALKGRVKVIKGKACLIQGGPERLPCRESRVQLSQDNLGLNLNSSIFSWCDIGHVT